MELNNTHTKTTSIVTGAKEEVIMDKFLACAIFGNVLNVTVIFFISARRRFRRQPRNLIWAVISFSNIFVLLFNLSTF